MGVRSYRHRALAAMAALALASSAAADERVSGEVRVGGGYDSNPTLAADPSGRRHPSARRGPPMREGMTEAGMLQLAGWVGGRLGASPFSTARLDVEGRIYGSGELLFGERLVIEGGIPLDWLTPRCRLEGARLDVSASDDSAWSGEFGCGATATLPLGFWAAGELSGGVRAFDVGQVDGSVGGELSAGWTHDAVALEPGFSALRRESSENQARRTELSPWVAVRVATKHVGGRAMYRCLAREFDVASQSGAEHIGRIELWGMPLSWLGAYVAAELGYASGGPHALSYERVQVTGGVRLAMDWRPERADDEPTRRSVSILDDGAVQFTYDRPDAARISVVGEFNGWDEERGRLERSDGGSFQGRFDIAPGRYQYHLLVDGSPERPPDAARYVQNGFGGENAILVVREKP